MQVQVKLMGMLKPHAPPDGKLDLPTDATIRDVLTRLSVEPQSIAVCSVNGRLVRHFDHPLQDGDELTILPPVGGG